MTHTPGPWKLSTVDDTVVIDATGNEVAAIDGDYNQPETWPVMEANARLIAAAPDLLEACKKLVGDFEERCMLLASTDVAEQECVEAARAAIAKAEGK